ncbi:hypothetical protein ACN4EE_22295 [Geminocystis sp. CENA526]|uniref:hypothetical protein n=1 Tax=Geminocystis sp. CENA526 TaxID=1355871 RepID=UPI003D6EC764
MARKKNLSSLIGEAVEVISEPETTRVTESESNRLPESQSLQVTESESNRLPESQSLQVTESESNKLPESQSLQVTESESNRLPESQSLQVTESESNKLLDLVDLEIISSEETFELKSMIEKATDLQSNKVTAFDSDNLTDSDDKVNLSGNQGVINSPRDEMMKETSFQGLENQSAMTIDRTAMDKDNLESQTTKVTDSMTNQGINSRKKRGGKTTAESGKKVANSTSTEYRVTKETELQTQEVEKTPKYLTLVRKEARLTEAQLDDLTLLVRKLNRSRHGKGERITENTLIRLAIDLLLQRGDSLIGATEKDLRQSLGLDSL